MDVPPDAANSIPAPADLAHLLAAYSRDLIFRYQVRPDLVCVYLSPACEPLTGYAPEAFYANPRLMLSLIHPDDHERVCAGPNGTLKPAPIRLRLLHREGQIVWLEVQLHCSCTEQGDLLQIEGSARDITSYVATEAKLDLIGTALEAAGNAVVISRPDGAIEWVNPAFTRLTGYTAEEAIGNTTRLLRSGQHDEPFYARLWATVLAGQPWSGELVNRRKNGTLYHEDQTITPVLRDGKVAYFITIKQDVSARVEREREREALLIMAAALRTARTRAEMLPTLLAQTGVLLRGCGVALAMRVPGSHEAQIELGTGCWENLTGLHVPRSERLLVPSSGSHQYPAHEMQGHPILTGQGRITPHQIIASAALRTHDEIQGALWICCNEPISESDLRLLAAIADMAANAIQRSTLFEQTEQRLRRLTGLHAIDQAITASLDQRLSLGVVLDQAMQQLDVDAADVLLLNTSDHSLSYFVGRGFRSSLMVGRRARVGEGLAGWAVLNRERVVVGDLHSQLDKVARPDLLTAEGFRGYAVMPLLAQGQVLGVLEVFQRTPLRYDSEWLDYLHTLAGRAAVAIDNAELFGRLQRSHADLAMAYDTTLEGWSRALDLRDKETEGHSQRVTELTVRLARAMGLSESEIIHIRRGALLHDIGKVGIPDAILHKPGPLTSDEWKIMQLHPVYGYELLAPISYLRPALDIPYCHHEKWDGSGYPQGLTGASIPLPARIFAVVDVWDALCSDRPYRKAWPREAVRAYLEAQSGYHFDPAVTRIFNRLLRD
ncbi:MAG: HD domain-containing phosphohydrolase [Oscillochloridaceae bacterium umkhey_bin13]